MKFTINKDEILKVLYKIQGITSRKSNLSITENIFIESHDSMISISATDLETGFKGYYSSDIEESGSVVVNSKKIFEIIKNFPEKKITIEEIENRWLKIGTYKVEYNIMGMNPEEFPKIPEVESDRYFEVDSLKFKDIIEKNIVIGHTLDEKRPFVLGVNLNCIDDENELRLQMVSTDGKRLFKADYKYFEKNLGMTIGEKIIIPKKSLNEVAKFLDFQDTIKIGKNDNNFVIKRENETIVIDLLEGEFPEYNDILIVDPEYDIKIDRDSFKMMLKRMTILTSDKYKAVNFYFNNNNLEITTANPELGESKEDIQIEFNREPINISFNPNFFIDALNFINSDKVLINIVDNEHPCKILGENEDSFLAIIMPMNLK